MRRARALAALFALAATWPAAAQDAERGRLLYDTHCLSCHYERIHKRAPARSRIQSYTALQIEVAERGMQAGRSFTREELDDIVEYLNRTHYRLQK
ncbi:MAG TPA: c-type cytochrome [Burkholderiales bacterium]